jgi:hypothetical protein
MSKHTPGPWTVKAPKSRGHAGVKFEIMAGDKHLADCHAMEAWDDGSQFPNACLIAATPTMYEYVRFNADAGDLEAQRILEAIDGHA